MSLTAAQKYYFNKITTSIAAKLGLGTVLDSHLGSHKVVACGRHASVGGDATESIAVSGLLATDEVLVTVHTVGATPRTVTTAVAAADAITVVMSGDPDDDHVLTYLALRAVS